MTFFSEILKNPVRRKQYGLAALVAGGIIVILVVFSLLAEKKPAPVAAEEKLDITGITGNAYTEKNTESALTVQQEEVSHLEEKLDKLTKTLESMQENQTHVSEDLQALAANQDGIMKRTDNLENHVMAASTEAAEHHQIDAMTQQAGNRVSYYPPSAHESERMSTSWDSNFGRITRTSFSNKLAKNNDTYVPPGTYAKAIVLGGADANASVTGTQDQTPIIFKLTSNGTIPGGGHSHLKDCVAIASTWGDISDERARVRLKHITCKNRMGDNTTIDEEIEGWVWYHGKSGIKGVPLMRDDKILTWAGLSGMLAGFASAAQYAETSQSVSALGAVNTVSPNQIATYGAYGGATTAMNNLSNYYIKRAEQYHPVIQVGAGNEVTVVFEKGFYIVPHENKNGQETPIQKAPASYSAVKLPPDIAAQMQRSDAMRQQAQRYQQPITNGSSLGQTVGVTS